MSPEKSWDNVITTVLNGETNDDVLHYGDLAKLKSNLRKKSKANREGRRESTHPQSFLGAGGAKREKKVMLN